MEVFHFYQSSNDEYTGSRTLSQAEADAIVSRHDWYAGNAPTPPGLEAQKSALLDVLAARRWEAEVGGMTVSGIGRIDTSARTQDVFDTAYLKALGNSDYTIAAFKFGNGVFAQMNAATIILIANAIEAHIQACFVNEKAISDLIVAAEDEIALNAISLETGWP